ncbi:MAG: peptidyl-prolyl cis-trans isomerase, partial [Lachnospiraceae bacterium]|nr:peptidyl-prolyl cis-trans isomerase [Lachnospiraceae bacterium]
MGKNVFKRLSIGLLTAALALSLLTGCGEINAGSTVLRVGDEKVSLGLANFFARYMQAQYETYYGISEDAWEQNVSDDETTYEASLKKDIMKNLQNAVLERQNAEEYKISLSDEDK